MSQKEFQRVKVIENAAGGRLSVREASRLLQLSERPINTERPFGALLNLQFTFREVAWMAARSFWQRTGGDGLKNDSC